MTTIQNRSGATVSEVLNSLLLDLNQMTIHLPSSHEKVELTGMSFVEGLKDLGRSGKLVRIARSNLKLPIQSHYDHITALGVIADTVRSCHDLSVDEKKDVACSIAYHDLVELIQGDRPSFTTEELIDGILNFESQFSREEANEIVRQSFLPELRPEFDQNMDFLERGVGEACHSFKISDQIEPITAIWRYLRCYKNQIEPERFLDVMTDFFANPNVAFSCQSDEELATVAILQSKKEAARYYHQGLKAFDDTAVPSWFRMLLNELIEKHDIGVCQ